MKQLLLFYCFAGMATVAMNKEPPKDGEGLSLHELASLMQAYIDVNISIKEIDDKLYVFFDKYNHVPTYLRPNDPEGYSRSLEQAAECLFELRTQATNYFGTMRQECEEKLKTYQQAALDDFIIFKLQQVRLGMFCLNLDLPFDSKKNVEREKLLEARNRWENAILCKVKNVMERSLQDKSFACRLLPLRKILASKDILRELKKVEEAKDSENCTIS